MRPFCHHAFDGPAFFTLGNRHLLISNRLDGVPLTAGGTVVITVKDHVEYAAVGAAEHLYDDAFIGVFWIAAVPGDANTGPFPEPRWEMTHGYS